MRRKHLLAPALVLLLIAVLVWSSTAGRQGPPSAEPVGSPEPEVAQARAPPAPLSSTDEEPEPSRALLEMEPDPGAVARPLEPVGPDEVRGHWVVLDAEGIAHAEEDGWFEFEFDEMDRVHRVEVKAGLWSVSAPAESGIYPVRLELGGRGAVPLESAWEELYEPDLTARLELEARWIPAVVLHVVDAQTQRELSGIEALLCGWSEGLHPGDEESEVLGRDETSPIRLPLPAVLDDFEDTDRIWARSRGYAWGWLEIPRALGGEYTLSLSGGGDLYVEVTGVPRSLRPYFRLRDPSFERDDHEGLLLDRQLEGDDCLELDGLPAGRYLATVEMGHHYRYPRVLDESPFELRSGGREELFLDVSSFQPPVTVEVRGELVVPVEWELRSMGLYLELLQHPTLDGEVQRYLDEDEMQLLDPALASYAWSFGELQAGTYEARFNPLGQGFTFEVPPDGMPPLRLEVPPPATLEVTVVDERSGRPVEDADVSWMPSREELETGGTLNGARPLEPGRFSLRSPVGDVEVWCWSTSHRFRREIVSLVAGHQSIELKTPPAEGILLRVLDGETPLTLRNLPVRITEVDGDGEGWLTDDHEHMTTKRFVVTHPGLYRVEVQELEGGYPVPPATEVFVREASFAPLDLAVGH